MFCRRKSFDTFYQYSLFVLFHCFFPNELLSEFSDWSKSRVYYLFEWIRSIGLQHAGISLKNCAMSLICRWARGRVRSSTSSLLDVRPSRRATVADRSFATAACPRICERSSWWCHVCHTFTNVSWKTESTFISTILPGHYFPTVSAICHGGPCSFFSLNSLWKS